MTVTKVSDVSRFYGQGLLAVANRLFARQRARQQRTEGWDSR
jgi:hypothetical protein